MQVGVGDGTNEVVTVFGYGSLLEKSSALRSCPSATNHRPAVLFGWRRVFSVVSVNRIKTGVILATDRKVAALAIRPSIDEAPCVGCLFELERVDLDELIKREHRYEMHEVDAYALPSDPDEGMILDARSGHDPIRAIVFVESTDEIYRAKCDAEDLSQVPGARFAELVGNYYQGQLWGRQDILPADDYICLCLSAARTLGEYPYRNFFDLCVLADGTSLKAYIESGAVPGLR